MPGAGLRAEHSAEDSLFPATVGRVQQRQIDLRLDIRGVGLD
jgi:hypothetical protein